MLSIFSCVCYPSVCFLWRNVCLGLFPTFWLGCLFFWYWVVRKWKESEVTQLCPTLCNPMDCSPPSSSGHGILQARILEWVAMPSCRRVSSSVQFSRSVVSKSLRPHEMQLARPPWPSPTPGVHSYSCPLSRWCHPAISSSVVPFSSCPQSLPASESFPVSQLFAWGGQSTGVSALASVLPVNTQDWSPLEWTG